MTDSLTGLRNRRCFDLELKRELKIARRYGGDLSLIVMDVDYFKQVNDTYGHHIGDRVLRMVAHTMRYALRATDTVGRWGGEEFIAILYDIQDQVSLTTAAEKLRTLVEYSRLDIDGEGLVVTLSIGGTLLQPGDTAEQLVQRADKLMYRSKRAGRNHVTIG